MKSRIIKLADISQYKVSDEYRDFSVSEETVQERLASMADNYGEEVAAEAVQGDCCVRCSTADGKELLVFPNMPIPRAEEISAALAGKRAGDTVTGVLLDQEITITVTEILTRISAEKDDELAKRAGIPGVDTLEQLTDHIRNAESQKKRNAAEKAVSGDMMTYLETESEASIDAEEEAAWAKEHAVEAFHENLAAGIDLRFTPEGEMLTDEEAIAMLTEDMKKQFKTMLVIARCCEEWNHTPDPAEYMAMLPPDMAEEEMSAGLIEQLKENDCYMFVLDRLTEAAREVLA